MKNTFLVILLGMSGCFSSAPVAKVATEQEVAAQQMAKIDAHIQDMQAQVIRTQGLIDQAKDQGVHNDVEIVTLKTDIRYFNFVVHSARKERKKLVSTESTSTDAPVETSPIDEISLINNELLLIDKCLVEAKDLGVQYAIDKLRETKESWVKELKLVKNELANRAPSSSQISSVAE